MTTEINMAHITTDRAHIKLSDIQGKRKVGGKRGQYAETKPFIAWDGEGMDLSGKEKPQSYVLYGCSTGDRLVDVSKTGLSTFKLFRFMLKVALANPSAIHVGFAFDYDVNMILKTLSREQVEKLWKQQYVYLTDPITQEEYCVRIARGKWITISRHHANWHSEHNPYARDTIKIYDIFSFFGTSFVKVCKLLLGQSEELTRVEEGKKHRGGTGHCPECKNQKCPFDGIDYVTKYWETEIKLLAKVAEELRVALYEAGYKINQWYGPGAIASYVLKQNSILEHMGEVPTAVKYLSCYAYSAGRFEPYKIGRTTERVYGVDLNSAYPNAIRMLPSLSQGKWRHVKNPKRLQPFALYHVRFYSGLDPKEGMGPAPLFHRSKEHNITYPWNVEGWYWTPEAQQARAFPFTDIVEGWEFIPDDNAVKPFSRFVQEMYDERLKMKALNDPREMAHKLGLNSMYGKFAQRVGWTEDNQRIPPWHRLEWAGWITSYTRALMWKAMWRVWQMGPDKLIAVETDAFYSTVPPEKLGLRISKQLGDWGCDEYDETIYLQSGLAWQNHVEKGWTPKRRGLDPDTFQLQHVIDYVKELKPLKPGMPHWKSFVGEQTRFIGMGAALARTRPNDKGLPPIPFHELWCSWRTIEKKVNIGNTGKRVHMPMFCNACKEGLTGYEGMHDLAINEPKVSKVTPHYVPWLAKDMGTEEPEWMDLAEIDRDLIA